MAVKMVQGDLEIMCEKSQVETMLAAGWELKKPEKEKKPDDEKGKSMEAKAAAELKKMEAKK